MPAPNFTLITELQTCLRRDFPLASSAILNPYDAAPLVEGEWLSLDTNYQLARATDSSSGVVSLATFPVHTEKGRYDTQAVQKTSVIFAGNYEADTTIFYTSGSYTVGAELMVGSITIGGISRKALLPATAGHAVVGFVTKVTGSGASAVLRFLHTGVYLKTA